MDDPLDAHPEKLITSDPPDIMNDFDSTPPPPQRRDTAASSTVGGETCRICRSEGTPDEPLFYPCKCSGSIKFVHQECLMEWLSHSHKKHCELCKTPFRFTKLYDANMPKTLPWHVFIGRACLHLATMFVRGCRGLLVGAVWLVILPWLIRWSWRWMFWFADAGWAREAYMEKMREAQAVQTNSIGTMNDAFKSTDSMPLTGSLVGVFEQFWDTQVGSGISEGTLQGKTMQMVKGALSSAFKNATSGYNGANTSFYWPHPDTSILSSWTYISETTANPQINRVILDIFEGQLITCVVIVGFILVFLIREWVVQQQPLVNLNANNGQREHDRLQREQDRLQRQAELLEQARRRLLALQDEAQARYDAKTNETGLAVDTVEFQGLEALEAVIDAATEHLRDCFDHGDDTAYDRFVSRATLVMVQIRAAETNGVDVAEIADKVYEKLATLAAPERQAWEEILVSELKMAGIEETEASHTANTTVDMSDANKQSHAMPPSPTLHSSTPRPQMPHRDTSSRATHIQRILEEADIALAPHDRRGLTSPSSGNPPVDPPAESASIVSAASTEGSWLEISPPNEQAESVESGESDDCNDILEDNNYEIPITNAGPDAKINIKRSGRSNVRAIVPELKAEVGNIVTTAELKERLEQPSSSSESYRLAGGPEQTAAPDDVLAFHPDNPFHPNGMTMERNTAETGDEASEDADPTGHHEDHMSHASLNWDEATHEDNDPAPEDPAHPHPAIPNPTLLQRLADWFWGDIHPQAAPEPVLAPNEELVDEHANDQAAPFVPVEADHVGDEDALVIDEPLENDPEVVVAAQQAGLDAEAVEEAEDLEGVFELIGLQGPLIGLFQTACFCCVLVTGSVFGAVGLPYVWGKLVLSFVCAPMTFLIKIPLQSASFVADLVIDVTLFVTAWSTIVAAMLGNFVFDTVQLWLPAMADYNITDWVSKRATSTAWTAGHRLQSMFVTSKQATAADGLGWNWALLTGSVHAHLSLKTVEQEFNNVLNYIGSIITSLAELLSTGSVSMIWKHFLNATTHILEVPAKLSAGIEVAQQHVQPLFEIFSGLRKGALTFQHEHVTMDPALVYWSNSDRGLAIFAGYGALAVIAAVYVAINKPITSSEAGKKTEKIVRDTLRQAGGVLKVILIISIEMLVFPLYCGMLLDLAFLPLFQHESAATRWAFAVQSPYLFCFVHWFVGTCYMFHFALFVGMCRKILRKGVLWFIRDPDDPTFHPVRDVLERNITTQLRKIAFSALVYGALVILCLGGVIWSIGRFFKGIFPIHWLSTEPILEFPLDLFLYMFVTPLLIRQLEVSKVVSAMYSWWLKHCARGLRLSHFLFDERRRDEEGRHIRQSWMDVILLRKANPDSAVAPNIVQGIEGQKLSAVQFKWDGKYVLTPCNDSYRPPKPGEAFLHSEADDVYIVDKDGKKNDHFSKIYVPPRFRLRISLFMVCLWLFSAFTGICVTLVPLALGRQIFHSSLPEGVGVNDIYAYSIGIYILGAVLFVALKGPMAMSYLQQKAAAVDVHVWLPTVQRYGVRVLKCAYLYGFLVILPLAIAMILHFYVISPLHTYMDASFRPILEAAANNGTMSLTNVTQSMGLTDEGSTPKPTPKLSKLTDHAIHIVSDYALSLLYLRIAARYIMTAPASRAAEAVRRITADGYLDPNVRLATRFFILPTVLMAAVLFCVPLGLAQAFVEAITSVNIAVDDSLKTLIYRYSYPLAAGCVMFVFGTAELANATSRWRARIRDEVYLVGERLHNFGEKKPPRGSRSVVRKEK
ncbi:hypothetical protein DOTSEDRAFT_43512 [Dothistroma septosporum NZE10]|uniref:RING-type E3 ubiquitin transferase n=1 Tax=Dothistroma septosporum (strain NZE10 / CBS 128990) TaxID=675120 RepID=N1PQA2_DOTSN|nr:hypothetical protein DOTSEDRAFT_43512 [Dothistroma septosporum NZE10]